MDKITINLDPTLDVRSGLDPKDFKYLAKEPDPGFSPERNRAIFEQTVNDAIKRRQEEAQLNDIEGMRRIDIVSSYARYRFNVGTKDLKGYLGKKQYEALLGEKLLAKLRMAESVNRLQGNTKFQKGVLI